MLYQKYDTIQQAVKSLKNRGYESKLLFKDNLLVDKRFNQKYEPSELTLDEYHRFPDEVDEDETAIVFAVKMQDGNQGFLTLSHEEQDDLKVFDFFDQVIIKKTERQAGSS